MHDSLAPALTWGLPAPSPRGVVLLLHGGAENDVTPVSIRSRPWQRSRLMMAQLQGAFLRRRIAVALLRYRVTGWNHGHAQLPSPVPDARWALDQVAARFPGLPVALLGHSMGARTAATVADHAVVRGVVALAPWFPPGEPVASLAGRHLVAAHGRRDRVTSFAATETFVRRAGAVAASARLVDMGELDHYMLRGLGRWNRVARDASLEVLGR